MNRNLKTPLIFALALISVTSTAFGQSFTAKEITRVIKEFAAYDYAGDPTPTYTIESIIRYVADKPDLRALVEKEMVTLLQSDATFRAKQFICHQLWVIGTDKSVPALEDMLANKETADIACYALRTHPSRAAARALRQAINRVDERTKLQIINILGDRKDAGSVDQLIKLLDADNTAVTNAAAISLGTIGTDKGVSAVKRARLSASGARRDVLTRALLRGAESLAKNNRMTDAMSIYETLFDASEPLFVRRSALVGALSTGNSQAVQLLTVALDQDTPTLRAAALANSKFLPQQPVTKKLIAALKDADAPAQVLIVEALAERNDPLVKNAIEFATHGETASARIAAFEALGDIGDAASTTLLCSALPKSQSDAETDTILASLRRMTGAGVDEALLDQLNKIEPETRVNLIAVISDRRYRPAAKHLLSAARDKNTAIATAAIRAVGVLAGANRLSSVLDILATAEDDAVRNEATRTTIKLARTGDFAASAQTIAARLDREKSTPARIALLRVLTALPCETSLARLKTALVTDNAPLQDAAVRALGQYPDFTAAKVLLDVFKSTRNPAHRAIALRSLIRLCKTTDVDAHKAIALYRQAIPAASTAADKKLILSGIAELPHSAAIDLVMPLLQDPAVKTEAALTLLTVAEKCTQTAPATALAAARKILADPSLSDLAPRAIQLQKTAAARSTSGSGSTNPTP